MKRRKKSPISSATRRKRSLGRLDKETSRPSVNSTKNSRCVKHKSKSDDYSSKTKRKSMQKRSRSRQNYTTKK